MTRSSRPMLAIALVFAPEAAEACSPLEGATLSCNQGYEDFSIGTVNNRSAYSTCTTGSWAGSEDNWQIDVPAGTRAVLTSWNYYVDEALFVQEDDCLSGNTCVGWSDVDDSKEVISERVEWVADGSKYFAAVEQDKLVDIDYFIQLGCETTCNAGVDTKAALTCSSDTSGSTVTGSDSLDYYTCGLPSGDLIQDGPESVYTFVPQATGSVTFTISGYKNDQDIYVLQGICDPDSCIKGSTASGSSTDSVTFDAVANTLYYIVIEGFAGTDTFNMSFADNSGGCREDCNDGKDNDGDTYKDCSDIKDCATDPACSCTSADYYPDADKDGQGDLNSFATKSCIALTGYVANKADCDDKVSTTFLGASEVCNGVDDDCDGIKDDGVLNTYFKDSDADKYGDPNVSTKACSAPGGYVADNKDCDDLLGSVHPGVTEVCNGRDDDCNSSIDDGVLITYFQDSDKDSYGNATTTSKACSAPLGYVVDNKDCNDAAAAINPGATEVCNSKDDDCDLLVDDADAVSGAPTWYRDADTDTYGTPLLSKTACVQPSGYVADKTDCNDTSAAIRPNASETCNDVDDDCDTAIDEGLTTFTWYLDSDKDAYGGATSSVKCAAPSGYVGTGGDCLDSNPAVNPGAKEVCNTKDDNCNTTVDEGVQTTYFQDFDTDSYGNPQVTAAACSTAPAGYVTDKNDCNDKSATVNPGRAEVCNTVDDNCDGKVDDASATDAKAWYADSDADKYGSTSTTKACAQPSGHTSTPGDCVDTNNTIYPGAPEICDSLDNDCNGQIDDGTKIVNWYTDADLDSYGAATGTPTAACNQPPGMVSNALDCKDNNKAINPAATEICDTIDNDCDLLIDDADAVSGTTTWYQDADADKYGNSKVSKAACIAPFGYLANDKDCNDAQASINPGAVEACNGVDDNCNALVDDGLVFKDWYVDSDKDSFGSTKLSACAQPAGTVAVGADCNDKDANIRPGADESCNGLDDDCDAKIDDLDTDSKFTNATTWFQDVDLDKYGNTLVTKAACTAPSGYIAASGDCLDTNKLVNPAATEICNSIDDDCDKQVDENASDAKTWYLDADKDVFGDSASTQVSCAQPAGYVASNKDCNDALPGVNPAATEKCNSLDDDCDAFVDEPDAVDAITWYDDDDKDTYGDAKDTTKACAVPAGYVGVSTDCDDATAATHPGADELCNGKDDDCDAVIDEAGAKGSNTYYADTDGDAYGDAASSVLECAQRPGFVSDRTDCNDKVASVHPTAKEVPYDGVDQDCDGLDLADVDGDGAQSEVVGGTDCDDFDASTFPGADETADGVDQDCDGRVDDGTTWYDDDGDGFTELGGDCDDANRDARPGGVEACNDADDDCDGTVDEDTVCYDDDGDCACESEDAALCVGSIDVTCGTLLALDCADGDADVSAQATEIANNGTDDDCDGSVDKGAYDPDSDGYTSDAGDCDPDNAEIHPGAPEVADGRDNDCDGVIDEGTSSGDDDEDGFTEDFGDCNDADPDVYTGATEDPTNGVDDDCDGIVDEGGPSTDDDGDGFSEDGGDCDDFDDEVNPAASELENGYDDDCDDQIDEDFRDQDGDGYNGDDDCDDQDGWTNPGTAEFCNDGLDNNCDGEADEGCEDTGVITDPGKCGCATGGHPSALLPLLFLLGFARRRSRV